MLYFERTYFIMKSNNSCPVKLYQKVKFDPFYGLILREYKDNTEDIVIGNITYINYNNNWFLAEYINPNGLKIGISFNFSDIGINVFKV